MDVKKIRSEYGNLLGTSANSIPENIKNTINELKMMQNSVVSQKEITVEEMQKIIESINSKIKDLGIYLAFDKEGNIPVVKVIDVRNRKVVKVFPPKEITDIVRRINEVFDILVGFILKKHF
jgi:uncharacterized FlaG/YvyC family protein